MSRSSITPVGPAAGCRQRMLATMLTLVFGAVAIADEAADSKQPNVRLIGATTVVTEVSTGLPLSARVDTGATSCSIHCESFEIKDADPDPKVNIGKPVRFLIKQRQRRRRMGRSEDCRPCQSPHVGARRRALQGQSAAAMRRRGEEGPRHAQRPAEHEIPAAVGPQLLARRFPGERQP